MCIRDRYIIRASDDSSLAVPSDITEKRKAIRDASKTIEDKINACSSLADFMKLFDTPVDKDGKPTGDNAPIYDFPKETQMPHIYDLNPHLKPKPKEQTPEVKKGRPKKVKDEQTNNDKSKS